MTLANIKGFDSLLTPPTAGEDSARPERNGADRGGTAEQAGRALNTQRAVFSAHNRTIEPLGPDASTADKLQHEARTFLHAMETSVHQIRAWRELVRKENPPDVKVLQKIAHLERDVGELLKMRCDEDRATWLVHHHGKAAEYARQLKGGRIAIVDYVREKMDELKDCLASNPLVTLYGDTGSGKTESARLVARELTGQDAIVIRCSPFMRESELYGGAAVRSSDSASAAELPDKIKEACNEWSRKHNGASEQETRVAHGQITERLLRSSGVTVSDYVAAGLYRAMQTGAYVILDEGDLMPPEIRSKINDLATKRPGESVYAQELGGQEIVVKNFKIIITQNSGDPADSRYGAGRNPEDTAQANRNDHVRWDYLPQATQGEIKVAPPHMRQLFQVVTAALSDRNGDLHLPAGSSLETLWNLSQFAAVLQKAGSREGLAATDPSAPQMSGVPYAWRAENPMSPRTVIKLLERWGNPETKDGAFSRTLDHHLFKLICHMSADEAQVKVMYQLAQAHGFFPGNRDWPTDFPGRDYSNKHPDELSPPLGLVQVPTLERLEAQFGESPVLARADLVEKKQDTDRANEVLEVAADLKAFTKWREEEEKERLTSYCPTADYDASSALG